jgi:hypothetical protein
MFGMDRGLGFAANTYNQFVASFELQQGSTIKVFLELKNVFKFRGVGAGNKVVFDDLITLSKKLFSITSSDSLVKVTIQEKKIPELKNQ